MGKRVVLNLLHVDSPVVFQCQRGGPEQTVYPDEVQADLVRLLAPVASILEQCDGVVQVSLVPSLFPAVHEGLHGEYRKVVRGLQVV